jgi:hypothetical protein
MTFAQRKLAVLTTWALLVVTVGLIFAINNRELWGLIATLVIVPVVLGNWLWEAPEATLSELIARGRAAK